MSNENNSSTTKCPSTIPPPINYNDKRPILVLINPQSGKGKSVSIYKKKIFPFFTSRQIEHHVFITEKNLRVDQFLKENQDLFQFKSIIVVSGDGLFFETLNSIMKHPSCEQIIERIPLGLIPTGSGNGLAYTLLRQKQPPPNYNEDEAIRVCCEQSIQDDYTIADLVKISLNDGQSTIWSFLSIGWGLLSDIDIDSEWLRRFGLLRFTIYGLLRSITSVSYKGRLSYEPSEMSKGNKQHKIENHDNNIDDNPISTKETRDKETNTASIRFSHSDDDVKDNGNNWIHVEDRFACVYAVYQSYISSVTKFAPKSTLTDQIIYLTYVKGKLNPCQIVKFLLAIADGSHEKLPFVTVVPVKRLKLEPLEESKIVVDGEVIPWTTSGGPISAEIVPKVLKLRWNSNLSL